MALGPLRLLPPGKGGSCPLEAQQILKIIMSAHRAWTLGGGSLGGNRGPWELTQVPESSGESGGILHLRLFQGYLTKRRHRDTHRRTGVGGALGSQFSRNTTHIRGYLNIF